MVFAAIAVEMHAGNKQDNIRAPMDEEMGAEGDRTLIDSGLTREEMEEELQMGGRAAENLLKCNDPNKIGTLLYTRVERGSYRGSPPAHLTLVPWQNRHFSKPSHQGIRPPKSFCGL